jgi:hypothetical protein
MKARESRFLDLDSIWTPEAEVVTMLFSGTPLGLHDLSFVCLRVQAGCELSPFRGSFFQRRDSLVKLVNGDTTRWV